MVKLPQISEAEFEVMRLVWDQAPVNTNEITEQLVQSTEWSPKTIQTLIRRLVTKGALTYEKKGRVFVYTPAVEESEYLKVKSSSFVEHYFLSHLILKAMLTVSRILSLSEAYYRSRRESSK